MRLPVELTHNWPRVGLTINKQLATERFGRALVLARSGGALPEEWLRRTREIGKAKNKTFTPVLGTALLAKATDRFVDAFSLREGESHKSYSARSLAKEVLVPCCVRAGVDIRNKGAEPLNNQPFLRAERISLDLHVKSNARVELEHLCACLERVDFLEDSTALNALAAFLRVRLEASAESSPVALGEGILELHDLVPALERFMAGDSEGGKVGQALVTAVLELVFGEVRTKAINDPSSKWPGDVGAFIKGTQTLSAEVKQRPFVEAEVLLFAKRVHESGMHRALIVALNQAGSPLDLEQITFQARRLYQVELSFFLRLGDMLTEACRYAPNDLPLVLAQFPRLALKRMQQLEVSTSRLEGWAALFSSPSAAGL